MHKINLGSNGPVVSCVGLGCMGMSDIYGPADEYESLSTIHDALDAGINLLDTGDFYGMGHNELLIGKSLKGVNRNDVFLSVKFGAQRDPSNRMIGTDARPSSVKNYLAYSLRRLGTDHVDIYRPARLDPSVPVEETIGAISDMVKAGYVRYIGLSEVGSDTIRKAQAVHPIADLQIEYSIFSRGIERDILPVCRELGIGITAYGVLSRGLLSGNWRQGPGSGDMRNHMPRFSGTNLDHNLKLVDSLRAIAANHDCSPAQLAIAWVISRGKDIVPVVGSRTRAQLAEALGSVRIELSQNDLDQIDALIPPEAVAGERYAPQQMAHLDSEKKRI